MIDALHLTPREVAQVEAALDAPTPIDPADIRALERVRATVKFWEDELESDLLSHEASFDFVEAMTAAKLLSVFCKMNYDG